MIWTRFLQEEHSKQRKEAVALGNRNPEAAALFQNGETGGGSIWQNFYIRDMAACG